MSAPTFERETATDPFCLDIEFIRDPDDPANSLVLTDDNCGTTCPTTCTTSR